MTHLFATIALGPLLLLQGRYVRRVTPRLPEPPGARQGECGGAAGRPGTHDQHIAAGREGVESEVHGARQCSGGPGTPSLDVCPIP